jgi:hypothetical protein
LFYSPGSCSWLDGQLPALSGRLRCNLARRRQGELLWLSWGNHQWGIPLLAAEVGQVISRAGEDQFTPHLALAYRTLRALGRSHHAARHWIPGRCWRKMGTTTLALEWKDGSRLELTIDLGRLIGLDHYLRQGTLHDHYQTRWAEPVFLTYQ